MDLYFSFVVPVYNRPVEIYELLESMTYLEYDKEYEIVIVEDGSTETAEKVIKRFENALNLSYYKKENTGPGDSRNYGMKKAKGDYFLILDSDVILPNNYLREVESSLLAKFVHCFGGPDDTHSDFTNLQKAISYSMTSFLTTGGIRGSKNAVTKFQPRSFNMGLSKEAFELSGGFGRIHPGEDPDLVIRLWGQGYKTMLIPNAKVFHKRRISWKKFFIQVHKFGLVRPILNLWHPKTAKITYWYPIVFVVYALLSLVALFFGYWYFMISLGMYFGVLFIGAFLRYRNITIAFQTMIAVCVQFYGYGTGFLVSYYYIHLRKKHPEKQFKKLFFK